MKYQPSNNERDCLLPAGAGALVFFISLGIAIPPAGNWLMASIMSVFAYPIIYAFSLMSLFLLKIIPLKTSKYFVGGCILFSLIFSAIGYLAANQILYISGLFWAFAFSGLAAGIVLAIQATGNKAINHVTSAPDEK